MKIDSEIKSLKALDILEIRSKFNVDIRLEDLGENIDKFKEAYDFLYSELGECLDIIKEIEWASRDYDGCPICPECEQHWPYSEELPFVHLSNCRIGLKLNKFAPEKL